MNEWQEIKTNYLRQIEKSLADIDHPQRNEILANVSDHLDNKFTELSPAQQNWEGYQQIITEMGPPKDYAELLTEETAPAIRHTLVNINTLLAAIFVVVLMIVGGYLIYTAKNVPPSSPTKGYVFEPDERVPGRWLTVDFVRNIEDFTPNERYWKDDLYLKGLTFYKNGTTSGPWTWTQNLLIHPGDHTSARYVIKEIQGETYLFMEWISGDVTIRREQPWYYVLKKEE